MLSIIWAFMTGVFLTTLGVIYHTPHTADVWDAIFTWGAFTLIVAVIQCAINSD